MSVSVLIIDMAHYQDPDQERTIAGFPSFSLAREFARRRVRDSVESLRESGQTDEQLRKLWYLFGEDVIVIGGKYVGSDKLDYFIAHPAREKDRDWASILNRAGLDGE